VQNVNGEKENRGWKSQKLIKRQELWYVIRAEKLWRIVTIAEKFLERMMKYIAKRYPNAIANIIVKNAENCYDEDSNSIICIRIDIVVLFNIAD
jgi:hypothetical protein